MIVVDPTHSSVAHAAPLPRALSGWVYPIFRRNNTNPLTLVPSIARNPLFSLSHRSENTDHLSPATNPTRIRTYPKHTRNPFRIRTSKTKHLKPFRMSTYRKRGRGVPHSWADLSTSPIQLSLIPGLTR